jgi:hypothetical protein
MVLSVRRPLSASSLVIPVSSARDSRMQAVRGLWQSFSSNREPSRSSAVGTRLSRFSRLPTAGYPLSRPDTLGAAIQHRGPVKWGCIHVCGSTRDRNLCEFPSPDSACRPRHAATRLHFLPLSAMADTSRREAREDLRVPPQ